ncbi:acetoacetate metabolism transcriptional regulator AtoC [Treponema sp.]
MEAEPRKTKILIADDEAGIRHGLSQLLRKEGYVVHTAEDVDSALLLSTSYKIDLAVLDIRLRGGKSGLELLEALRSGDGDLPVIMITGYGSIDSAIQAMKFGAADYLLKPIENSALVESVRRNLEIASLRKDNRFLRSELLSKVYEHQIITEDPGFLSVLERADRVKDSEASLLITGESGTGKEVLARYVHFTGERREGPFVGINCAAISETLLLSELFGHEKGAFTGAVGRHIGKFELADKGTLFLDEIGDMSLSVQAKLLRVLEESSFERVGGVKRISVDIRVIAATNRDLGDLIQNGLFRSDLFYRIAIMDLHLPPLRERPKDIPLLIIHFLQRYAEKYRKKVRHINPELLRYWTSYAWPGNVRELQNAVNQAVLLSQGEYLDMDAVGSIAHRIQGDCPEISVAPSFTEEAYKNLKDLSDAASGYYEKRKIESILAAERGNQSRTAKVLGVTRKTLARKIEKYGIFKELQ